MNNTLKYTEIHQYKTT